MQYNALYLPIAILSVQIQNVNHAAYSFLKNIHNGTKKHSGGTTLTIPHYTVLHF